MSSRARTSSNDLALHVRSRSGSAPISGRSQLALGGVAVAGGGGANDGSGSKGLGGVRGQGAGGSMTMERSEDEKSKFPDRINLDRKGLHGIPILEDEPGLRLLSLQHNFIKRIQHLDSTFRLVFLDLYHNRLDTISNLEPLVNLRVLMLGKNRIRRMEGLQKCNRLSVLDLHGNRITQITGLDNLSELKVLNLAGNLIRKITNLQGLSSLEELNIRRNRIRSSQGLEVVPTLEKLYMSNNEIQGISSLPKLEALLKLHTVQMEGNPVWSSPEYAYHLVTSLPELKVMDQQDVAPEVRAKAAEWKERQTSAQAAATPGGAREQLLKKMEERNVSISNAKTRWSFLKAKTMKTVKDAKEEATTPGKPTAGKFKMSLSQRKMDDGEENSDAGNEADVATTATDSATASPTSAKMPESLSTPHLSLSRQTSRSNLFSKLNVPSVGAKTGTRSSPGSPTSTSRAFPKTESSIELKPVLPPPVQIKNEVLKKRFPGLERRKFSLPHKFVNLRQDSKEAELQNSPTASKFAAVEKKIGFFHVPQPEERQQSTSDEFSGSGAGLLSDSSSDSSSSDVEDQHLSVFPTTPSRKSVDSSSSIRRNASMSKLGSGGSSANLKKTTVKASAPSLGLGSEVGRTSEQGRDYLIELDGDLLSVYGAQSLKFLDRPWNRLRAMKATTVQFNFVAFDDLVGYLPKFRMTFPNVQNFEFLETDINSLGQLNALASLQGITSLFIGEEGNPIYPKNWRIYAIYRLEHWGLRFTNNAEITDEDIITAHRAYGSLGELAVMVLPQPQLVALARKLDLLPQASASSASESQDLAALIKDANVKEILAKEALQYKPVEGDKTKEDEKNVRELQELMKVGHSAFHKLGRLDEEWNTILPILIKRIMSQYSDLRQYKKDSLVKLEKKEGVRTAGRKK